jgi:predicted nucleic acid-binding protein
MAPPAHLLDTNILLRLSKSDSPEFPQVRSALRTLRSRGSLLCYTAQNVVEFWNVSTRPMERNGHGLSVLEADENVRRIERAFLLLSDNDGIYHEWRRLVLAHSVAGAQVHDARLVAAMHVHGITHLLTLNDRDFTRYPDITIVRPRDPMS